MEGQGRQQSEAGFRKSTTAEGWERSERSGRLRKRTLVQKTVELDRPSWEDTDDEGRKREGSTFLLVMLVGLLFLLAGVGVFLKGLLGSPRTVVVAEVPEAVYEPGEPEEYDEIERGFQDFDAKDDLGKVREAVARFLGASDVGEMLTFVRDRARVEPAVRAYYSHHEFTPRSPREIAGGAEFGLDGQRISVLVELEDFSTQAIALEKIGDRYLVDWESWVVWGELTLDEFQTKRPTEPVLMRVKVWAIEYYNFEFSDDIKWQSYRLTDHTGEYALYGYARRASPVAERIVPLHMDRRRSSDVILRLRYPEGSTRSDQVIIDEVVAHGWVLPSEPTPPEP